MKKLLLMMMGFRAHRSRVGLLREPAADGRDSPHGLRAAPPDGEGDGVRAADAPQLQHEKVRGAVLPGACRRHLL